jgi:hypothetical protein
VKTARPRAKATSKAKPKSTSKAKPKAVAAKAVKKYEARKDLGAPVDGFFAKQAPHLRPILEVLRGLVTEAAPDASSSIKWGMPFYKIGDNMMCALAGFKAHVNLILPGAPGTFADPDGILEGEGKTGQHLKLRSLDDLPRATVLAWLRVAAGRARG